MAKRASLTLACLTLAVSAGAGDLTEGLKQGNPELRSAGAMAFGPDGILFIADAKKAAVFAIDTAERDARSPQRVDIQGVNEKIAAALGTSAEQVQIQDMAVNPASGSIYLSVARGRGPDAAPVLLRVDGQRIEEVPLENVRHAELALTNAPADEGEGRRNQRSESITDLAFMDGRLIVAGLSNEEFASKLRAFQFPFEEADPGTSVEIFHGAHGQVETRSPVRTFIPFEIDGQPHIVAAYTCTPLVTFPVAALETGKKVRGTTVAELGNRNRPLDMITYTRDGKSYILMANSARGMMRIPTEGIGEAEGIEEKIDGKAGLGYETIAGLEGVTQLDRINDELAVVIKEKDGKADLATIDTP